MASKKLKDHPKFNELHKSIEMLRAMQVLQPFLPSKLQDVIKSGADLAKQIDEALSLPERFNNHFVKRGWIAYDCFNMQMMREAISLADNGMLDRAEEILSEYYNDETIKFGIIILRGINDFRLREELAIKAKEDYLSERYYACIPILFIIIDGLVCDIAQKSLFAESIELEAWDCIAAHSDWLKQLVNLITKTRKKTSTDPIYIPYRNGIIHGRDLNFANKLVAAKCWGLLFAILDWGVAVRDGRKGPPPAPQPEPTVNEQVDSLLKSFDKYREAKEASKRLEKWQTRSPQELISISASGYPEIYNQNSPERKLSEFMLYWSKNNYGFMAKSLWSITKESLGKVAKRIRMQLQNKRLNSYRMLEIVDEAPAITEILTQVELTEIDLTLKEVWFRLIYVDENNNPLCREEPNGKWLIVNLVLHEL